MIYKAFQDKELSQLGFGTMRLPLLEGGTIDEARVQQMVDYALANGINYFDTAYPYHQGKSELAVGKALSKHPRESFYLADKYPGHQIASSYDPAAIFEEQLQKCGVEYFDFYLLHNVYEKSIETYMDPQWGILDYFLEQKRLGRIKHLGFSTHGNLPTMEKFLDYCGQYMEFCQIQLNYLDWTIQKAKEKCELLNRHNIPIWVMEPVRGGKLARLPESASARLQSLRPDESVPAWALRWLQDIPGVTMILSGMSNMEQMQDNVKTFSQENPLSAQERQVLADIATGLANAVPCTGCRYCCDGCPIGLDIPDLLTHYNDLLVEPTFGVRMRVESLPPEKRPEACLNCGQCSSMCPQNIDVPAAMADMARLLDTLPSWEDICREREEAAKRAREGK